MRVRPDGDGYLKVGGGIRVRLSDSSQFGHTDLPTLRFHEDRWREHGVLYPEVSAVECSRPLTEFCAPREAAYEITRRKDGAISIDVFTDVMPASPVMSVTFPTPDDTRAAAGDPIYAAAFAHL